VSYVALPLWVQMLFSRDWFIHFCLANCDTLLGTANRALNEPGVAG
jgi:hypothetical protein